MTIEASAAATVTVPGNVMLPTAEIVVAAARQMHARIADVRLVDASTTERDGETRTRFVFRNVWS